MIYKFKEGYRVTGVKAQDVGDELQRLRDRDGKIETLLLVREAKKERSPIHGAFEWDDSVAAHQHRLYQARQLIKSINIIVEDRPEPAFVHIKIDNNGYYQSSEVACKNIDEWDIAYGQSLRLLESASNSLEELDKVASRVRKAKRTSVKKVRKSVDKAVTQLRAE